MKEDKGKKTKKGFKFDWEGGLSKLKEKYTSVELQHKALELEKSQIHPSKNLRKKAKRNYIIRLLRPRRSGRRLKYLSKPVHLIDLSKKSLFNDLVEETGMKIYE